MTTGAAHQPGVHELAAAWEGTARAVLELARTASEEELARPTTCPGWDVHDHVAHLVGVECWFLGRPEPPHELPDLPHVRHEMGRQMEVAVDLRRGVPGPALVAELEEVLDARAGQLVEQLDGATLETVRPGPFGDAPLGRVLSIRCWDTWSHEQDVREALGRPGGTGSDAARAALRNALSSLPRWLARETGVPVGSSVRFVLTGPLAADVLVVVEDGEDGRPVGRAVDVAASPEAPDGVPTSTLTLTGEAFLRRAAGRWPVDRLGAEVGGDRDLAATVLDRLPMTP